MAELYTSMLKVYSADLGSLEADAANDAAISSDLNFEIIRHPSLYLKWATLAALAADLHAKQEGYIKYELYPFYYQHHQSSLLASTGKAVVAAIDTAVAAEPAYVEAKKHLQQLALVSTLMQKIENAMYQKKDMIQALASRQKIDAIQSTPPAVGNPASIRPNFTVEELEALAIKKMEKSNAN